MPCPGDGLLALAAKQFSDLTASERKLLHAVAIGAFAMCKIRNTDENDPTHAETWDKSRTVRSKVLRWLCIEQGAIHYIDPKGIRILGAKIEGLLNLECVTITFPIILEQCAIPDGVRLKFAETRSLSFEESFIGSLDDSPDRPALDADGIHVRGDVSLCHLKAEGRVSLVTATITGDLDCTGGKFHDLRGMALIADNVHIGKAVLLCDGFQAKGVVRLVQATIAGDLDCDGGRFSNPGKSALVADKADVGGEMRLGNGCRVEGGVHLARTKIGAHLNCYKAEFCGEGSNGLDAQAVVITGFLVWTAVTTNSGTILDLSGARAGQLVDDKGSWPARGKIDLDGFVYTTLLDGPTDAGTRLDWLERQTPIRLAIEPDQLLSTPTPKPFRP